MTPRCLRLRSPTDSSLASISPPPSRPMTTSLFAPRSTSSNGTSSLTHGMIGGLVAIGILALLSAVGLGFVLHVHYCRHDDCSVCTTLVCFARQRSSHTIPVHGHDSPRLNTHPETPRARVYIYESSIQDSQTSSRASLPPPTPPPKPYDRGPQPPRAAMPNSAISIRGSITPTVVSNNRPPALGTLGTLLPHPSPQSFLAPSEGKGAHSGGTLDHRSNPSENMSVITLPSFVEHEHRSSIPSPILTPPGLSMVKGVRSLPSSRRSSLLFHPSRSPGGVANSTSPATPRSEAYLRRDFPSPTLPVPDWRPHPPHRTCSSTRWAGARRELGLVKPKSEAQTEAMKVVKPRTPETLGQTRASPPRPNTLPPLKIPTNAPSLPGDYGSPSLGVRPPSYEGRDVEVVPHTSPQLVPPRLSPHETLRGPAGPRVTPPAPYINDTTEPSRLYLSPVPSFSNSQSSCSSHDEGRARVVSQARSSTSTVPSVSAFPSPPGFRPAARRNAMLFVNDYSTSRQPFLPATLGENNPVGSVETTSPNEGQTLIPLSDADTLRPMSTVDSLRVFNGHPHPELMGRDDLSVWSGGPSSTPSMRRLTRIPLGPRQMSHGPTPVQGRRQPPSV